MDRPFPHDTTLDGPAELREPRPEQDPDDAMEAREERDRLEREYERDRARRAADRYHIRAQRQRAVDLAEKAGRLCPYGAEYVAGEWPFDPF